MSSKPTKPQLNKVTWADGRYAIIAHKQKGVLPEDPALRRVTERFGSIIILRKR